ncbi:MAG: hypothetical protein P1V51_16265 [Deltaproteobacteria bacterium]|nr:hypothetical protein [Deltaproteobacteria bacterium]
MMCALKAHRLAAAGVGLALLLQAGLGLFNFAGEFNRGHNGWNTSAYHQSAKNTWRWGVLFPLQYDTGVTPPRPDELYTHHPLGMHLHNTAAYGLFGDETWVVRGVMALQGLLVVLALCVLLWWLWSPGAAAIAGLVYVAIPINAIYLNMANHSSGFLAWGLAALGLHLAALRALARGERRAARRWRLGFLLAFVMAALWDWPAAYLAAGVSLHLLGLAWRQRRQEGGETREHLLHLLVFLLVGLATVATHAILVELFAGGLGELASTAEARATPPWSRWAYHLRVVPPIAIGWFLLGAGLLWAARFARRVRRGEVRDRDLVPLIFGVGGLIHYLAFPWSAVVHSYWAWTMLPFFAIAAADLLPAAWPRSRATRASALALALAIVGTYAHAAILVPAGREVGGALWFVRRVRDEPIQTYWGGYPELRLARWVRAATDRETGVLVHRAIRETIPEPRFFITLDREYREVGNVPSVAPRSPVERWVFVAPLSAVPLPRRAALAARHPYRQVDDYFMVDLSRQGRDIEVFRTEPAEASLFHRFFVDAWDPPREWIPDEAAEAELLQLIGPS